ncbi:hypothetical protein IAE22_34480, partial [Bacillus sp. S34]|nr:hypothetical protein [Bacillus sp. S34]
VEELRTKIAEMKQRRVDAGLPPFEAFGMAAYVIVRETEEEAQAELARITDVQHGQAYESYQDFISNSRIRSATCSGVPTNPGRIVAVDEN